MHPSKFCLFLAVGGLVTLPCLAQEDGQPGCTTSLDEAAFGKPKAKANKYNVTVLWRTEGNTVLVKAKSTANGVGTSSAESDWYPVGIGWIRLQYSNDLYFRVNYLAPNGYMLDAEVSELGSASCTWGR